jgi:hypothetical protein
MSKIFTGAAAAALAVVAATGGGVGNAAATAAPAEPKIPARATFDYIGKFANVASAPKGTPPISGEASMVVTTRATTTSVYLKGLDPKNTYAADVHDHACFENEGGNRFLFDPNGPPYPPNAIFLLPIKVNATGVGTATTTSAAPAGPRAKSIILHLLRAAGSDKDEANPPRLACADLVRVTS